MPGAEAPQDRRSGPGPVTVPAPLCGPLLRVLVRALAREAREDGGTIPPGIAAFLADLAAVVDSPTAPAAATGEAAGSGNGTVPGGPAMVEVSAADAAAAMGASREYVRRLARSGRLPARRIGRTWLITMEATHLDHDPHGTG